MPDPTPALTSAEVERIKSEVMTHEAHGGLWVTAEDYAELRARAERAEAKLSNERALRAVDQRMASKAAGDAARYSALLAKTEARVAELTDILNRAFSCQPWARVTNPDAILYSDFPAWLSSDTPLAPVSDLNAVKADRDTLALQLEALKSDEALTGPDGRLQLPKPGAPDA